MANWQQITTDFQQKYYQTYVEVVLNGRLPTIFFIKEIIQTHEGPPELILWNDLDGQVLLKYDTDSGEIHFNYPEVGFFSHNGQAWLCFRKHDRRWIRGVCDGTIDIRNPYYPFYPFVLRFNCQVVSDMFKPLEIFTILEATRVLKNTTIISIPLTRELALGQDVREGNQFLLWFHQHPIATLFNETLTMKSTHFTQEIKDYLRQTGQEHINVY